ncbi:Cthe_2314 family HEPN domain-containing protein [Paenibacillus sp. GCM10023252]|uniref:Cthe_2314 family HEPN domain-containing protein n=1 Tax=Paenibacillus sp. GCM10023252 TaxID=3252649 RepID=UPI00361BCF55
MLRLLLDEPPRIPEGRLADTFRIMEQFASTLHQRVAAGQDVDHKLRTYEIWTRGLLASLDELEQSHYAAGRFGRKVKSAVLANMGEEEQMDYYRYVYFDKNAFIRIFSMLDKLGTLLNDSLQMHTERIKPHFSYFTVLRTMREKNAHTELTWRLNELKESKKEVTNRLRKRRNSEIHYMNSEMQDDLVQSHRTYGEAVLLENIEAQMVDLSEGLQLVIESVYLSYDYMTKQLSPSLK